MRAKKVDTTHGPIRDHLKSVGWAVRSTAIIGDDFPDLIVARRGFTALVECKTGKRRLTEGQSEFARSWPGVCIKANSPKDAELQLDLAEKYTFLRHPPAFIERPEDYTPPRPQELRPKPKARPAGPRILNMLGGEC